MKLATIEKIISSEKHPNADSLSICSVLGFRAITKLNQFKTGDKIVFIQPDCVLPEAAWSTFYKSKSNRTKAIKLRKFWSEGIIESLVNVGLNEDLEIGMEVSEILKIIHYEPPVPKELNAKCALRFGLTKTDEERWNNLESLPYGEEVTVTLKIDGSSASYFVKQLWEDKSWETGITSRSLELKPECVNNYTLIEKKYDILRKLKEYCLRNHKNYCLRGECYGQGIQSSANNPFSKLSLGFAAFSLFNFDSLSYEPFYKCVEVCKELDIPTVPILEKTIFTKELIEKYSEGLDKINNQPFEGVVIKLSDGKSFKIVNKHYDAAK